MARSPKKTRSLAGACLERPELADAQAAAAEGMGTFEDPLSATSSLAWKPWFFAALLIAAVFCVYRPAWHGTYVWDDDDHLVNNPVLNPGGLATVWVPGGYLNYWPLTYTVYRIEYQFWRLDPLGYHLVNIGLHCLAALLVWQVLVRLRVPGALFGAAIFALHPVNVESVAWIAQLKGLLSVTLALLTVLLYLGYEQRGHAWRYVVALIVFALSALAKGEALTLPIVFLALAWWQRGRITRNDLLRAAPFALIAAGMAAVEVWTQYLVESPVIRTDDFFSRAAIAGRAVWFYLGKLVWPANLIPFYPRWTTGSSDLWSYLPDTLLLAAFGVAWWKRRTWGRPLVMMIVCYVALLLPVLGFVNIYFMRYSLVADHWQYIATIVPCAIFAGVAATLARRYVPRGAAWLAAVCLLAGLGALSSRQSETYANVDAFYGATIASNPDCWLAHYNLGEIYGGRGQMDAAMDQFRIALTIKPDYAKAQDGLGQALVSRGQLDEALTHYHKALEIDPKDADADFGIGDILISQGKIDSAIDYFRKAVAINPNHAEAHNNLGNALLQLGKEEQGIAEIKKSLELNPNLFAANYNLADEMLKHGKIDSAIGYYERAAAIKPGFADAHYNLGSLRARRGEFDAAIAQYQQVLKIRPADASASQNLAAAISKRQAILNSLAQTRELIRTYPDKALLLNAAASTLATDPNASIRNGAEAVELAERASNLSGGKDPAILDTLAAAYAENGKLADAMRTASEAERLANAAGDHVLAEQIRGREELYKRNQPFRQYQGE